MNASAPNVFRCQRRGTFIQDSPFVFDQVEKQDYWRDDGTCSYCGSIKPEVLLDRIEDGSVTITATDKSYKIYVNVKSGEPFYQTARCERKYVNGMRETREGNGDWYRSHDDWTEYIIPDDQIPAEWRQYMGKDEVGVKVPIRTMAKFYFYHFYDEQGRVRRELADRFMKAWRENRIAFEGGIAFYVKPMFLV